MKILASSSEGLARSCFPPWPSEDPGEICVTEVFLTMESVIFMNCVEYFLPLIFGFEEVGIVLRSPKSLEINHHFIKRSHVDPKPFIFHGKIRIREN